MKPKAFQIIQDLKYVTRAGNALDPELVPTDRVCERYAVSIGDGLPSDKWADERPSRFTELDPETAIKVDRIIIDMKRSIPKYHRIFCQWYRTSLPRKEIAKNVGIPRSTLYLEWRCLLWYLRGRFQESGIDV